MLAWLGLALAASPLDGVDPAKLEVFAMEHPRIASREAMVDRYRLGMRAEVLTPVRGLNIGTGLVPGDQPGSGPKLGGQLWLSVNVTEALLYPNRVRSAKAELRASQALEDRERRLVVLEVRELWTELQRLEDELGLLEDAVAGLEVRVEAANQMFVAGQMDLDQLSVVEGLLLTARQNVVARRGDLLRAVHRMEELTGHPLSDARLDGTEEP